MKMESVELMVTESQPGESGNSPIKFYYLYETHFIFFALTNLFVL